MHKAISTQIFYLRVIIKCSLHIYLMLKSLCTNKTYTIYWVRSQTAATRKINSAKTPTINHPVNCLIALSVLTIFAIPYAHTTYKPTQQTARAERRREAIRVDAIETTPSSSFSSPSGVFWVEFENIYTLENHTGGAPWHTRHHQTVIEQEITINHSN